MRKRILEYRRYMDELLSRLESGKTKEDIAHIKEEHLVQIGFFQHERLIHLIVTVLFLGKAYLALGNIMITALFIAYYFLHLRQLGAFSPDKDGDAATDGSNSNSAVTA